MKKILWIWIFLMFYASTGHAFPELTRHGYTSCLACHVSPRGGGVLTQYGRGLSSELLSTWGSESEAGLFHGLLKDSAVNEWLSVGGDIRGLQYHYENSSVKDGRWIPMQASLEVAAKWREWTFSQSIGKYRDVAWQFVPTQVYALYQATENWSLKLGHHIIDFGLNIPEHVSPTRSTLGFGTYDYRDAAEVFYGSERTSWVIGYSKISANGSNPEEQAWHVKWESVLQDSSKWGLSAQRSDSSAKQKTTLATHAILGFTKSFFLLSELDWQEQQTQKNSLTHLMATYQKLGYEWRKGLIGFIVADGLLSPLEDPSSRVLHYGLGAQWFPRPHFEFESVWTREQAPKQSQSEGDYAWILLHYYL